MIRKIFVLAACSGAALLAACSTSSNHAVQEESGPVYTATASEARYIASTSPVEPGAITLFVNGMGCPLCATNIDKQLERLDGVSDVVVNLGDGKVALNVAGEKRTSPKELGEAVEEAGFTLVKIERAGSAVE